MVKLIELAPICLPFEEVAVNAGQEVLVEDDNIILLIVDNGTSHIRHQCRKTTVLSCHRCLINTGVEKMNNI